MPDLSFLHSLFDGFQKKLGDLVAGALWVGGGLAGKYVWDIVQQYRLSRQQAKQSDPIYLANKQISLDVAADRACVWAGCDHAGIYQFSNGSYFSNNDSIQKMSMTGESVESNLVRRWRLESQNLATAAFPYLTRSVQSGHVWLYRDAPEDFGFSQLMRQRGYECALAVLLQGAKGAWLGLLILSWGEGHYTDESIDLKLLEEHRLACASILAQP